MSQRHTFRIAVRQFGPFESAIRKQFAAYKAASGSALELELVALDLNPLAEQRAFAARFGYPLAPPQTWPQFTDMARFFTRPNQNLYGTVFAAFPDGHNTVYDFCLHLWSRGGELTDAAGNVTLDTPQARAALDFYRQMAADRTATYPDPMQIDSVQSGALFREGRIAMMVNWFGFAAVCEQPNSPTRGKVAVT